MTDLSWAIEVVSLLVLVYSLVTLVRLHRGRLRRGKPPEPPVNVRARLPGGEVRPLELVYVMRLGDGRALWTPVPTTAHGSVPLGAELVASVWPKGTVVIVGYRGEGESMVRSFESAEEDG